MMNTHLMELPRELDQYGIVSSTKSGLEFFFFIYIHFNPKYILGLNIIQSNKLFRNYQFEQRTKNISFWAMNYWKILKYLFHVTL